MIVNFRLPEPGERPLLYLFSLSIHNLNSNIGEGIGNESSIGIINPLRIDQNVVGHEGGHYFGLKHQDDGTGHRMSYDADRNMSWDEAHRLDDAARKLKRERNAQ